MQRSHIVSKYDDDYGKQGERGESVIHDFHAIHQEKCIAEIIVEIGKEEFESAIGKVFIKNRNRISVPGFRKGKAPRRIVEKIYGASLFHSEALEMLLPGVFSYAAQESGLKTIGRPQLTNVDIKDDNEGVDVMLVVSFYPEFTLGEYKGLSAFKPGVVIHDSEVDADIEEIRHRNARYEKTDRPVIEGDTVFINFEGFIDGEPFAGGKAEDFELTIGSNSLIPGFEEKIIGMSTGEERSLDLIFPSDYKEPYTDQPVVFKVKLNEIREKILPDIDDEFVKDVSEFDTFEEYKADIREKLLSIRQTEADEVFENTILEKIIGTFEVDLPDILVEEQMEKAFNSFSRQITAYGMDPGEYMKSMGKTPEEFKESSRQSSEQQVKIRLALAKIAELEGLEASPEEIEHEYNKAALSSGKDIGELRKTAPEESVAREIRLRLASEFVMNSATIENSESGIRDSELSDEDIITIINEEKENN